MFKCHATLKHKLREVRSSMIIKLLRITQILQKRNSILKQENLRIYPEAAARLVTIMNKSHDITKQNQCKNKIQKPKRARKDILI